MKIIDEAVLDQFRGYGACEWCRRACWRDPEHTYRRGQGSSRRLDIREVLVALCRECHTKAESGHGEPSKDQLKALVAKREGATVEEIRDYVHLLWRLPKGSERPER